MSTYHEWITDGAAELAAMPLMSPEEWTRLQGEMASEGDENAPSAGPLPPDQADRAELLRRVQDALLHYGIGEAASADFLPVDWAYVARRMAEALTGHPDE